MARTSVRFHPSGVFGAILFIRLAAEKEKSGKKKKDLVHGPTFVFCTKRHPSKLMGWSHQHKYAAARVPPARSLPSPQLPVNGM